ncbi:MAG: ATP-binding protein [Halioglobus sp.]
MDRRFFSLQGKLLFFCLGLVSVSLLAYSLLSQYLPFWSALVLSLTLLIPMTIFVVLRVSSPAIKLIKALQGTADNIKDQDFSVTIASHRTDELGDLVATHNEIGQLLREERHNINQRELLLDTVLQSTPVAMWLCDDRQRVVYSNVEARQFLAQGERLQGALIEELIAGLDEDLAVAIRSETEGLVSIESGGEVETYYLSCRFFSLNSRLHRLHLVRRMTREISRQEVDTWKRLIRVISHELNNSLAPISSLTHSGKVTLSRLAPAEDTGERDKLALILTTIGERASHLKDFIEGYAKFSRLPAPKVQTFELLALLRQMSQQQHFEVVAAVSELMVQLDQTQLEQVLINLLKNARDACGDQGQVQIMVENRKADLVIVVADNGPGMSDRVMQQALLPFYSTKQEGTGLGLPLCREIVEGHGGQLSLRNGIDAGLQVVLRFPQGGTP